MRLGVVLVGGAATSVLQRDGNLVDLGVVASRLGRPLPPAGRSLVAAMEGGDASLLEVLAVARSADPSCLPQVPPGTVRFLPPVPDAATVLAVGLNYRSHCAEQGRSPPAEPMFFAKLTSSLAGHGDPIPAWSITGELDYEGELAVVVGRGGRAIPETSALDHVFGYTVLNDVTARDLQRNDRQWTRAKGLDGFAPFGPFVVTRDEVPDPQALRLRTWVNGELRQDAMTDDMTFSIARIVAFASQAITLRPGDVITTGTPAGVGVFAKPPRFLVPGDVVTIRIDGVGELRNAVVRPG